MSAAIRPLCTVSPWCTTPRACPGFLIIWKDTNIMLDCGNGCTGHLRIPEELENLHIFVSHMHKDHFGDIGVVQYASFVFHNLGVLEKPVQIYLPRKGNGNEIAAITHTAESFAEYHFYDETDIISIGDVTVSFADNRTHSVPSYMARVRMPEGSVAYTADIGNGNLQAAADFCRNADLLICESSFCRNHGAVSTHHLHAFEAGILAKMADVKKLLLTHFWQDTPKETYLAEAKAVFVNSAAAEEGESIDL